MTGTRVEFEDGWGQGYSQPSLGVFLYGAQP